MVSLWGLPLQVKIPGKRFKNKRSVESGLACVWAVNPGTLPSTVVWCTTLCLPRWQFQASEDYFHTPSVSYGEITDDFREWIFLGPPLRRMILSYFAEATILPQHVFSVLSQDSVLSYHSFLLLYLSFQFLQVFKSVDFAVWSLFSKSGRRNAYRPQNLCMKYLSVEFQNNFFVTHTSVHTGCDTWVCSI